MSIKKRESHYLADCNEASVLSLQNALTDSSLRIGMAASFFAPAQLYRVVSAIKKPCERIRAVEAF